MLIYEIKAPTYFTKSYTTLIEFVPVSLYLALLWDMEISSPMYLA